MVLLIYRRLTFCQYLGRRETRKLTARTMLAVASSSDIPTLAMATPMQVVFLLLSWNLMDCLMPRTLAAMSSPLLKTEGNLPALLRPGPNKRGILRMRVEEAKKASYLAASFFTSFLFLFNFLRSSTVMQSIPANLAVPQSFSVPNKHTT